MIANYLDENNNLKCGICMHAPKVIQELFEGAAIPVVFDGRLFVATYEREIDGLFLHNEIKHEEIIAKANNEMFKRYSDAITTAFENNKTYMSEVYKALNSLLPPWNN